MLWLPWKRPSRSCNRRTSVWVRGLAPSAIDLSEFLAAVLPVGRQSILVSLPLSRPDRRPCRDSTFRRQISPSVCSVEGSLYYALVVQVALPLLGGLEGPRRFRSRIIGHARNSPGYITQPVGLLYQNLMPFKTETHSE